MMRTKYLIIACFTALFPALCYAQPLKLEYQTPAGATPNLFAQRPCASCIPMDMDGDKKDETVFFFNLPNGRRQYVLLSNGVQHKWPPDSVCCPEGVVFRGFYNFDGTGLSEGWFSTGFNSAAPNILGIPFDTNFISPVVSFKNNWRLLDARNTDGDSEPELVLYNTATKRMEFWGKEFTPGVLSDAPPLAFSSNLAAGETGFEVQSTFNNARFAPSELVLETDYQDYNGDKIPDIVYLESTDDCKMTILNGKNRQTLWSGFLKLPPGVTSCTQLGVAGFFDFDGNGIKSAYIAGRIPDSIINYHNAFVFDPATNTLDNSLKPFFDAGGRSFAFRDVDKDGKTEIVVYNAAKRQVIVLGVGGNRSEHKPEPPEDYASGPFSLKLRFESIPGARLPQTGSATDDQREMDFNGDGAADLCIWKEMPNDTSIAGLTVVDMKSKGVLWEYFFSGAPLEKDPVRRFHGFFDADGDGQKELYLGDYTVITADKTVHRPFGENFTIQLIRDLDSDGFPEVLGRTAAGRIQIWSRSAATGLKSSRDVAITDLQCYPNPASGIFWVEYALAKPETVRIQLFDLQGRLLATPQTPQARSAGLHRLNVSLEATLPNGVYFVVIDAGGRQRGWTLEVQR